MRRPSHGSTAVGIGLLTNSDAAIANNDLLLDALPRTWPRDEIARDIEALLRPGSVDPNFNPLDVIFFRDPAAAVRFASRFNRAFVLSAFQQCRPGEVSVGPGPWRRALRFWLRGGRERDAGFDHRWLWWATQVRLASGLSDSVRLPYLFRLAARADGDETPICLPQFSLWDNRWRYDARRGWKRLGRLKLTTGSHVGWEPAGILGLAMDRSWSVPMAEKFELVSRYEPHRGRSNLSRAYDILRRGWPETYGPTQSVVRVLSVGIGVAYQFYDSSSDQWLGIVHVSDCPPLEAAEAILHEASHQYLLALNMMNPAWLNDESRVFSPWKRKLRPSKGMLMGIHAFTITFMFYNQLAASDPARATMYRHRMELRRDEVRQALASIRPIRDHLPPLGRAIVDACDEIIR